MKLINEYTYIIKKSKFIGMYYEVNNLDEVNSILDNIKKEHKKATHFPYSYKIDNLVKKTDDKEPSNTAGTPILSVIEKNDLNNVLLVIIRYFGGTKLGVGTLLRSYLHTAKEVIKKAS